MWRTINYTYSIPCAVCLAMSISWNMSNLVSSTCRWRYRLLPSHHWVIIAKLGFVIKPMKSRMLTWRVFLCRKIRERRLAKVKKKLSSVQFFFWSFEVTATSAHPPQNLHLILKGLDLLGRWICYFENLDSHVAMPLATENCAKGACSNAFQCHHLTGVHFPVVAGISVSQRFL